MDLTNPDPDPVLGRSSLLSISQKLVTQSGTRPFTINSFRLASLLALLVGLNLSFLTGALARFIKITEVVHFRSVDVFRKDLFLALYFSLSLLVIFRSFCLLLSAVFFVLTIWPFGPYCGPPQEALFRLERWCLPLNPRKCGTSFSRDPHQANLQPNLFLLNSRHHFNPTPTFLGVTFNRTLSFSKHVSSLKAKFFPHLKALPCISAFSLSPSKESLSVLYKAFL